MDNVNVDNMDNEYENLNINLLSVFKSFYTDMCKVFPEYSNFNKNYSSIMELETVNIEENNL